MAKENVVRIPLYNVGNLSCVGFLEGCGYNVKVYWGDYLLSSKPNLVGALQSAYVGVRLFSLDFDPWLTSEIRLKALDTIQKAFWLIDGRDILGKIPTLEEGFGRSFYHGGIDLNGTINCTFVTKIERDKNTPPNLATDDIIISTLKFTDKNGLKVSATCSIHAQFFDYGKRYEELKHLIV